MEPNKQEKGYQNRPAGGKTPHAGMKKRKRKTPGYSPALLALVCLAVLVMAGLVGAALFAARPQDGGGKRGFWRLGPGDGRPVLALDAGHGGKDPGAMAGALTEAEINRVILEKLSVLLEKQAGELRVVVTNGAEESATPGQRGRKAKSEGASLLVSLHLNASEDAGVRGFSCLPVPPGREFHEESLAAAQIFIEEAQNGTGLPLCGQSGVFYAYYLAGEAEDDYTKRVMDAAHVDENTHPGAPTYGILENAGCPGLLVEQWYLTNGEDMGLCYNEDGMNRMAESLYRGICRYFGLEP